MHELLNCTKQNVKQIIMMDADSIVRKNLDELFDDLVNCDIMLRQRHAAYGDNGTMMAGVMCVNNTRASKDFFAKASDEADKIGMTEWFSDQKALYKAYPKCKNLRLHNLSDSYIDWAFKDESHIWVGKGGRKDQNARYAKEEKKYL